MARIAVVDLFAGPGGLGEGFSTASGTGAYHLALSIEADRHAHRTLWLRAFFRSLHGDSRDAYYDYVRGDISIEELRSARPDATVIADGEAWHQTLSRDLPSKDLHDRVSRALNGEQDTAPWVLIGGPPCQAYSLAGRSRMLPVLGEADFDADHRHVLYREYLWLLGQYAPPVFVMENVKGILSSRHEGRQIFEQIRSDLEAPGLAISEPVRHKRATYRLLGLAAERQELLDFEDSRPEPSDFILRAEDLGIPQARHRVFIIGIRTDLGSSVSVSPRLEPPNAASVGDAITGLPRLRSGLSRERDSSDAWIDHVRSTAQWLLKHDPGSARPELERVLDSIGSAPVDRGHSFVREEAQSPLYEPGWFEDCSLAGTLNHETRGHRRDDLARYLWASCFARVCGRSPTLRDFPESLLPQHRNVGQAIRSGGLFSDRFRVQVATRPASTITSHISKDGHYFIHPDPEQCRSLTVREAARLQTFPDNYFFEGPRTSQYVQVGNAVPPILGRYVAEAIAPLLQ